MKTLSQLMTQSFALNTLRVAATSKDQHAAIDELFALHNADMAEYKAFHNVETPKLRTPGRVYEHAVALD